MAIPFKKVNEIEPLKPDSLRTDGKVKMVDSEYFEMPNAVIDAIAAITSDSAFKVYCTMIRKTFGWGKESDALAVSQIMELTGKSKPTVIKNCLELVALGLIQHTGFGAKGTKVYTVTLLSSKEIEHAVKTFDTRSNIFTPKGKNSLPQRVKNIDPQKKLTKQTTKEKTYTHTADADASPVAKSQPSTKPKKQSAHDLAVELLMSHGVSEQVATDYMQVRKAKRAGILTITAMNLLANQAKGARLTVEQAVLVCIERNWVGFNADWLRNSPASPAKPSVKDVPVHTVGGIIQGGW